MASFGWPLPAFSDVKKAAQAPGVTRVHKLSQRFGLDLADALARHREAFADLFERMIAVQADADSSGL